MITVKNFHKAESKPNARKDDQCRLRVGAAVGAAPDNEERVKALVVSGVDVLLIDSSHGHYEGFYSVFAKLAQLTHTLKSSVVTWRQLKVRAHLLKRA